MGQKSPVVIQHTQEAELTGSFGRLAFLKVGHLFFQPLGALGGHLITEKGDLMCSEDTLPWVDKDPIIL
jgi:hypothetical protein